MMEKQVLLDKLSEFLMVEQGGLQLYRVAAERCTRPDLKERYQEFGKQTARHREVYVQLIQALGGDPNYVSPTARLAQVKATKLIESAMIVDGLAPEEIMASDLENVLLAETKCHLDWELVSQLAEQATDATMQQALQQAVQEVEQQEDEHVEWARQTLSEMGLQMVQKGPAPPPERWMQVLSGPMPPIKEQHPEPVTKGLMAPAKEPAWGPTPIARDMQRQSV
jgi:rubrerythrin